MEDGIRHYKEQMIPAVRKMARIQASDFLVDREKGKSIGMAFWDTEKNLQAGTAAANKLRASFPDCRDRSITSS